MQSRSGLARGKARERASILRTAKISPRIVILSVKMLKPNEVESPEEVEKRARGRLRTGALVKSALLAGLLIFVVPSGGPWMSNEAFLNVMGRVVTFNAIADLIGHFILAFLYGWIVALCIYSLPLAGGIMVGAALSIPLWGLNYLLLGVGAGFRGNELHTFLAHLQYCIYFSVAYRAMAVPRPRRKI